MTKSVAEENPNVTSYSETDLKHLGPFNAHRRSKVKRDNFEFPSDNSELHVDIVAGRV